MANIKRNLIYNFILSCTQVLIPLLSIPYLSRILDPEGVGKVGFIDSFSYYFVAIAEFGITVYGIREVSKLRDNKPALKTLVSELIFIHILSSSIALLLYLGCAYFVWNKIHDTRLLLFSLSFLLVNILTCEWYFWGVEKFGFIAFRTIMIRILGVVCIFLLIKRPPDYYFYYAIITVSAIVGFVLNFYTLFREVGVSFRSLNWRRHIPFILITYLISLFYAIPLMLDNVILGFLSGAAAVGIYAFSSKVLRIAATLLNDSFLVFFPRIVFLNKEDDQKRLQGNLKLNIQFIILASVPMSIGVFLIADELTYFLLGPSFTSAADNIRILCLFPFIKGVSLFLSNPVLVAHHKEKIFLKNLIISGIFFILIGIILSRVFNDKGMSAALCLSEALLLVLNYQAVRRVLPQLDIFDGITLLDAILCSLIFLPIVYLVNFISNMIVVRVILDIVFCTMCYAIMVLYLRKNEFALKVRNSVLLFFKEKEYRK